MHILLPFFVRNYVPVRSSSLAVPSGQISAKESWVGHHCYSLTSSSSLSQTSLLQLNDMPLLLLTKWAAAHNKCFLRFKNAVLERMGVQLPFWVGRAVLQSCGRTWITFPTRKYFLTTKLQYKGCSVRASGL